MAKKKKKQSFGRYANGLEKHCGDSLQSAGFKFNYEDKFTIMEGFKYPSPYFKATPKSKELKDVSSRAILPITYKPDFHLPAEKVIIETKGFVRANDSFPLRWKVFMNYLMSEEMSDYSLFIPRNKTQVNQIIEILLKWKQKS